MHRLAEAAVASGRWKQAAWLLQRSLDMAGRCWLEPHAVVRILTGRSSPPPRTRTRRCGVPSTPTACSSGAACARRARWDCAWPARSPTPAPARLRTGFRSLSVMGLPLPCMRSGRSLWLQNDHSAGRLGTPKALVVRPVRGMRGRCRGCASRQRADGRTSPSADRIQRRSRMFPGRMRAGTHRPPLPGGEVCAQRSGRARIHRNLGLIPYGCQAAGRAGRSARSVALSAYHEA